MFLVGVALPRVGNTEEGIAAYAAGNILAFVLIVLSAGFPSVRYGLETVDAAKASFGTRGMILIFVWEIVLLVGTALVAAALTATTVGNVVKAAARTNGDLSRQWLAAIGLAILLIVWLVTSKGPKMFERVAEYLSPVLVAISAIVILIIFFRFGVSTVLSKQLSAQSILTTDKLQRFTLAFEWGAAIGLSWWPAIGGITRLVGKQSDVLTPPVLAFAVFSFLPMVGAALASVTVGTSDPTWWLIVIGGRIFGTFALLVVILGNMVIMVIQFYLSAVASQQIRFLARMRWEFIVALLLMPGIYLAFWPNWVLNNFTTLISYMGVMFAGITAVTFVDYFVLRRHQLQVRHLFTHSPHGRYYFWYGFNLMAVAVVVFGVWFDLWMYNPVTMSSNSLFRYVGATIPTVIVCAALYYILMRVITIPNGKGGYLRYLAGSAEAREDEVVIAL